jgi:Mg-chelatase subunit ChlD
LSAYSLDCEHPEYLLLLLALPLLAWWGRHSLSAMGRWRQVAALVLRGAVVVAITLALAEVHIVRTSDRLAVVYLVDRSESVAPEQARTALDFVNRSRADDTERRPGDLTGVVVFGRQAAVEQPPHDTDVPLTKIESPVDGAATDLADALRLGRASLPPDCAKRLVVLSDGNENLGSAVEEARPLVEEGVGIDVVPLGRPPVDDVAVEKVALPSEVRRNTPFDVRVVLNHAVTGEQAGKPIAGKLRVFRRSGEHEELALEQDVTVEPGKRVFTFREELDSSDFYSYDVQFVAENGDGVAQNNRASAFTQVHGQGRVLLIEDWSRRGEFNHLVERLREARIEVDVRPSDQPFASLAELQRYDSVIMADVARTSDNDAGIEQFGDDQVEMLVRNTQQMGSGLVMLGGANSFGAGGWANTRLEEAMPVDFQIKNAKVVPIGALMLVLDRSGSMSGEKINMSKAAAIAALKVLGERDHIGVVAFDSEAHWLAPMQKVGSGARVAARISQLGSGGGTDMMPGMREGYQALARVEAAVKHMIVLTDGQTAGDGYQALAAQMKARGITTTCVAVGADSALGLMQTIAQAGGGKFYRVDQPKTIPRIFMREARRIARPLVYENDRGIAPQRARSHEMLLGIDGPLPPITGYVMTSAKDNPLVELALTSPLPGPTAQPLLASWTYGLGRAVVLTTDAGQRWASGWTSWGDYDRLFTQIVRWSMRPTGGDGRLNTFAEVRDGKLRVVVTALDQQDEYLNFLPVQGTVVGPDLNGANLDFKQFAPGRYQAELPASASGNYFVTVAPGNGGSLARVGVSVPHSAEFRATAENRRLLNQLAAQTPRDGAAGRTIELDDDNAVAGNVFRRDLPRAIAREPFWQLALLAGACLFFFDVFNRRVMLTMAPLVAALRRGADRMLGRVALADASADSLARLQSRKAEVARQLSDRMAAARFEAPQVEPSPQAVSAGAAIEDDALAATRPVPLSLEPAAPAESDAGSYTGRLLAAKRAARRDGPSTNGN